MKRKSLRTFLRPYQLILVIGLPFILLFQNCGHIRGTTEIESQLEELPTKGLVAPDPKEGLVAHWDFNQHFAGTVVDQSGNGYTALPTKDGTISFTPGTPWGEDKIAFTFDGRSGLTVNNQFKDALDEVTVEAWVKPTQLGWQTIFSRELWNTPMGFSLQVEWAAGKVAFGHYGIDGGVQSDVSFVDGQWHQVVGTMKTLAPGRYLYSVFIDGVPHGSAQGTVGIEAATNGVISLGYFASGLLNGPWGLKEGSIAQVLLFRRALSNEEIQRHFETKLSDF